MREEHSPVAGSVVSRHLRGRGFPLLVLLAFLSISCANVRIFTEDLPIAVDRGPPKTDPVPLYEKDYSQPPRALIPFAQMGAHGTEQSTRETLKSALAKKGAQMGADAVWVSGQELNKGATVTSYGSGMAFSQQTQFLSMYAQACMYSPVRIGVSFDNEYKVTDVVPGGAAARAGWRIGDRLLAIGGIRVTGNPIGFYQALASARPGQELEAELVAPDNEVRRVKISCDPNE